MEKERAEHLLLALRRLDSLSIMYMMYVDESGDPGLLGSPGRYFVLSGITVHERRWKDLNNQLLAFRRTIKAAHGLPVRVEIHSAEYIRRPPAEGMQKHVRLAVLRNLLDELAKIDYIRITNIVVDKQGKPAGYDVFAMAWKVLFQRFENTIKCGNFPGSHSSDNGIIFVDNTNGKKLNSLVRKMGAYNPIPNRWGGGGYRQLPTVRIIEDPQGKDSRESYCIQAADVTAFFLYQSYAPNTYVRRQGASNYFKRLTPVLNTRASTSDQLGIVML